MQGASPLASPELNPGGTGFSCGKRVPAGLRPLRGGVRGGVAVPGGGRKGGWSPADLATVVPNGGLAFLVARLPFYFSLLSFPHPPDPLPGGKGEIQSLFRRGLRPRHPGIRTLAALTSLAMQVPGG